VRPETIWHFADQHNTLFPHHAQRSTSPSIKLARLACSRADDHQHDFNTTCLALKAARIPGGFFVRLAGVVFEDAAQTCGRSARLGVDKRMEEKSDPALGSMTSLMAVLTLSSMLTSANSGTQVTKIPSFLR
jgi:hypothetical protein